MQSFSLRYALIALFVMATAACASLGLYTPQTFIERAVAAQLTATSVRTSATKLLNSGAITVADAKNAQTAASNANEGIDIAVAAYKAVCPALHTTELPDPACAAPPGADAKLTAVVGILQLTQSYLKTKEPK